MNMNRYEADQLDTVWTTYTEDWDKEAVHQRAMTKINGDTSSKKRGMRKRTFVVMLAAVIMIMGTFTFGAERDWDIRFAEHIGLGDVMTDLPGGWKAIDASQTSGSVTLTVSQAIGDKNSQWVQIDSSLPWEGADAAWETFDTLDLHVYDGSGIITGASSTEVFSNDGNLSFLIYMVGYEGIHRAEMVLTANTFSGETFTIKWQNYYAANAETTRPFKKVILHEEDRIDLPCIITKIEVTPVSLNLKAWANPFSKAFDSSESAHLTVDAVILEDGTVINVDGFDVAGMKSSGMLDCFISLVGIADGSRIKAINIGGKTLEL